MTPAVALWICLAGLLALLCAAAVEDVRSRRIPNWLTGGVAALYPIYVLAAPEPVGWLVALGVASLLFALGLGMFAYQLLGGGDVKLISALSLWAGLEHLVLFLAVMSVTGGVLALGNFTWARVRRVWSGRVGLARQAVAVGAGGGEPSAGPEVADAPAEPATLPYGVAVAAGGLAVAFQLMNS